MVDGGALLRSMIEVHDREGASVLALLAVEPDEISAYGCAEGEEVGESLRRVRGVVEKPRPADAKSNLAVIGRYVFTPGIFDALDRITPGVGGELQLTDAIALLLDVEPVFGRVFSEGRYDIGQKLDFLRANIELALDRPDLGPELAEYLRRLVARRLT
jgi:UTP--glucose-1-phosphate uridylyltransferase